jgi:hypothetical protein
MLLRGGVFAIALLGVLAAAGCALRGGTVPLARRLPTVTVTCVVTTAEEAPIAGARCQSEGIGATTDAHGIALLKGVPAGDRLLVVTAAGYVPGSQPYTVSTTSLAVAVRLRPRAVPGGGILPPQATNRINLCRENPLAAEKSHANCSARHDPSYCAVCAGLRTGCAGRGTNSRARVRRSDRSDPSPARRPSGSWQREGLVESSRRGESGGPWRPWPIAGRETG